MLQFFRGSSSYSIKLISKDCHEKSKVNTEKLARRCKIPKSILACIWEIICLFPPFGR